jgi:hypothetical protein
MHRNSIVDDLEIRGYREPVFMQKAIELKLKIGLWWFGNPRPEGRG